jgi:hypothetical protein
MGFSPYIKENENDGLLAPEVRFLLAILKTLISITNKIVISTGA